MASLMDDEDPVAAMILLFPATIGSLLVGQIWITIFCGIVLFSIISSGRRYRNKIDDLRSYIGELEQEVKRHRAGQAQI